MASVAAAVDAADTHPGPDTVSIGVGTQNLGDGVTVTEPNTSVHGAGVDATVLTADPPTPARSSKAVIAGYMARLSDLTVRLPSADTGALNSIVYGVDVYNGDVEHVKIDAVGATFGSDLNDGAGEAMIIRGQSTVRDLDVDFDLTSDTRGVRVIGPADLRDVDITAPMALYSDPEANPEPKTVTARRVWLRSDRPLMVSDGHFELSDAVLDARTMVPGSETAAAWAVDGRLHPTSLTMDRVTMVGNGDPDSSALGVDGQGAVPATAIRARHLVASGFAHTVRHANYGGDAAVTIDYSNVDTGPGAIVHVGDPGGFSGTFGPGNRGGDPRLVAPAAGDFNLAPASPAIDIGGDDLLVGDATDLAGAARPIDGDGDGTASADAGAFEASYEPTPPSPPDADPPTDADTGPKPEADRSVSVLIDGAKLRLAPRGTTQAILTCPDSEVSPPCSGTLRLDTKRKLRHGKRLKLAEATFSIGAGQSQAVDLQLSRRKANLVQASKRARKVIATANVADEAGNAAVVAQRLKLVPTSL
jgi:hypothetical protein